MLESKLYTNLDSPFALSQLTMPKSLFNSCCGSNELLAIFVFSHIKISSTSPIVSHFISWRIVQVLQYLIHCAQAVVSCNMPTLAQKE